MLDLGDGSAEAGNLEVSWHAGWPSAKHDPAPEIQVHAYNPHTVILRQNKSVSHEAPFMFLLFGSSQALLLDTGATANPSYFPLRRGRRRADSGLAGRQSSRRLRADRRPHPTGTWLSTTTSTCCAC
jgi:hypothetical protein